MRFIAREDCLLTATVFFRRRRRRRRSPEEGDSVGRPYPNAYENGTISDGLEAPVAAAASVPTYGNGAANIMAPVTLLCVLANAPPYGNGEPIY